jgi:alanyl-tRNA synthetase
VQAEAKEAARVVRRLQDALAVHRAAALREGAETIGPHRGVLRVESELDASALKGLASAVVSGSRLVVVLVGRGEPVPVVVARSADSSLDAAALLRALVTELGGRGGGTAALAQGGLTSSADAVLVLARERLSRSN